MNIGYKNPGQVSHSVEDAKAKKVLVAEYKIKNIKSFDATQIFPFQTIWEEKPWNLILDKSRHETYQIDSGAHNIVFSFNNKSDLITESSFVKNKWIMWMNDTLNLPGSISGMINVSLMGKTVSDTDTFKIYKTNDPHSFKHNLTKLFEFTLQRQ